MKKLSLILLFLGLAGAGVAFGIVRPLLYHKNASRRSVAGTAIGPSVAIIPASDFSSIKSVQFLYSWQF
jgi:hypothetical protein